METLKEAQAHLASMSTTAEIIEVWNEFMAHPVEMALGGKNAGYETITQRFCMWRKGTRVVIIAPYL